jgi:hypothetical protein
MSPERGSVVSRVWVSVSSFLQCRSRNNGWLAAIQESSGLRRTVLVMKTSRHSSALHYQRGESRLGVVLHRVKRVTLSLGRAQELPRVRTVHRPNLCRLIDSQHLGFVGNGDNCQNPWRGADRRAAVQSLFRVALKAKTSFNCLGQSGSRISKVRPSFEFERTEEARRRASVGYSAVVIGITRRVRSFFPFVAARNHLAECAACASCRIA